MPKRQPGESLSLSARAITNMRVMRGVRKWSVRHLAELVTAAGCSVSAATLCQVDMGRRKALTVDELFALAKVFGVSVEQMVYGPACPNCGDRPAPAGFVCSTCGRDGHDPSRVEFPVRVKVFPPEDLQRSQEPHGERPLPCGCATG